MNSKMERITARKLHKICREKKIFFFIFLVLSTLFSLKIKMAMASCQEGYTCQGYINTSLPFGCEASDYYAWNCTEDQQTVQIICDANCNYSTVGLGTAYCSTNFADGSCYYNSHTFTGTCCVSDGGGGGGGDDPVCTEVEPSDSRDPDPAHLSIIPPGDRWFYWTSPSSWGDACCGANCQKGFYVYAREINADGDPLESWILLEDGGGKLVPYEDGKTRYKQYINDFYSPAAFAGLNSGLRYDWWVQNRYWGLFSMVTNTTPPIWKVCVDTSTCEFCNDEAPGAASPNFPAPGAVLTSDYADNLTLSWNDPPNPPGWGNACSGYTEAYGIYLIDYTAGETDSDPGHKLFATAQANTASAVEGVFLDIYDPALNYGSGVDDFPELQPGHEYGWRIRTWNGAILTDNPEDKFFRFTIEEPLSTVRGVVWNSTGKECSYADKEGFEIGGLGDEVLTPFEMSVDTNTGTWNPDGTFGTYSYNVTDVQYGTKSFDATNIVPTTTLNEDYVLRCLNDSVAVLPTTFTVDSEYEEMNLGYDRVTSIGATPWVTVLKGDIYGGRSDSASVSLELPDAATVEGNFVNRFAESPATLFLQNAISITTPNSDPSNPWTDDGNKYYARYLGGSDLVDYWPKSFSFVPTPGTINKTTGCSTLLTTGEISVGQSYSLSRDCMQAALDGTGGTYNLGGSGSGVAVLYVSSGASPIVLGNSGTTVRSADSDRRILIITEGDVEYSHLIGEATPDRSAIDSGAQTPHVQAGVISSGVVTFTSDGSGTGSDTTIVVEGPVISNNPSFAVQFNRDRGSSNLYPSTVIVYNPIYFTSVAGQSISGPEVVDVRWMLE